MVFIDRPPLDIDADCVLADNRGGARSGVAHLIEQGHSRIACFSHLGTNYTARERLAGYRDALDAAGIRFDERRVVSAQPDATEIRRQLDRMRRLDSPPTAVFTTNNRSTAAFLTATSGSDELALVGFDDFELATAMHPPVTVVAQKPIEIGRAAAQLLFEPAGAAQEPRHVTFATELIVRGSSLRRP
jgi:LacI family transcriptional regulator